MLIHAKHVWIYQQYVCVLIEWDVNQKCLWWQNEISVLSNSVLAQCKLQNKYYQLNLATVILCAVTRPELGFFAVTRFWPDPAKSWLNLPLSYRYLLQVNYIYQRKSKIKKRNQNVGFTVNINQFHHWPFLQHGYVALIAQCLHSTQQKHIQIIEASLFSAHCCFLVIINDCCYQKR